jgi:hypothetical protein
MGGGTTEFKHIMLEYVYGVIPFYNSHPVGITFMYKYVDTPDKCKHVLLALLVFVAGKGVVCPMERY